MSDYFDANTRSFLRFGQSGAGAIRRAVWGPGVQHRHQAFDYVNRLLCEDVADRTQSVVDLGCGVGQSLQYLADRGYENLLGVTLSGVQTELAQARGLPVETRDFEDDLPPGQVYFGFESLLLVRDMKSLAKKISDSSAERFIICDDFLERPSARTSPLMREFYFGWCVEQIHTVGEWQQAMEGAFELRKNLDLTAHLELRRPRDRMISALLALTPMLSRQTPWWKNLRGGDALQRLLLRGDVSYRYLVFERI